MDIKKIIKEVLSEGITDGRLNPLNPYFGETDPTSLVKNKTGGSGAAQARSEFLIGQIEKNFSKMGIYGIEGYMETQGIYPLKRIKEYGKPFKLSFKTRGGKEFNGECMYDNASPKDGLILNFKDSNNGEYKLFFDTKSLHRPFMGKTNVWGQFKHQRVLLGLQEGGIFNVQIKVITPPQSLQSSPQQQQPSGGSYKGTKIGFKHEGYTRTKNILREFNPRFVGKKGEVKITKIGIPKIKSGGKNSGGNQFSDSEFTKVKGQLNFMDDQDDGYFTKVIKNKISNGVSGGEYFVRLTKKSGKNILIFSTTDNDSGVFFTLGIDKIKVPQDTSQWRGNVIVGDKALGDKDFKGSEATIKNLTTTK